MKVWIVRALGWAAAVAVLVVGLLGRDPEVGSRQRELLRTYEVPAASAGTLALPVRASAREIRVRWWLEDPAWGPADDRVTRPAQVAARLVEESGRERLGASSWLLFRRRPVERDGRLEARDRLRGLGAAPLSDPRVWRFSLPERGEPGTLELSVLDAPPGARLFAAVWAGTPGEPVLGGEEDLPEPGLIWVRLSALEGGGRAFSAQVIDAALGVEAPPPGVTSTLVSPGGAVAFNLSDARAVLHAEWWTVDGEGPVATRALVQTPRGVERSVASTVRAVPGEAPSTVSIVLSPSESPRLLRAWTDGGTPASWGVPPSAPIGIGRAVGPDLRRTQYARVGPAADVSWTVEPGETLRIVARPRLPWAPLPGLDEAEPEGTATLTLAFQDDAGVEITRAIWTTPRIPSGYERYGSVDTPLTARVGEATAGRVSVPDGVRSVRIKADATVEIAVWTPSGLPDEPHPAYAVDPDRLDARHLPLVRSAWRLRAPEGADALLASGRLVDIDGQVRLESPTDATADAEAQRPRSVALRPLALARPYGWLLVASDGQRSASGRARVGPKPRLLRSEPDGSALIEVRRPPDRVAEPLRLRVEGRDVVLRPRATTSTHRLAGLPDPFVIATEDTGVIVVPQRDGELRKLRAWPMAPGDELAFDVPASGGRLAVQAWGAGLTWRIDGELQPGRVYDALPVVAGQLDRAEGPPALVFSELQRAVSAVQTFRRGFEPASGLRRVVLTASGATWVRPLASWAEAESEDEERIWWLPEPIAVAEASP